MAKRPFTRIEFRMEKKADLEPTVRALHALADKLAHLRGEDRDEAEAVILALHAIRETSKKLRGAE